MKIKLLTLVSILLMVASASTLMANPVIFSNAYDPTTDNAFTSVNYNGDNYYQDYADFYYDGSFTMTDFHWWGGPDAGMSVDSFHFMIYDDDTSEPGTMIYDQLITDGANPVTTGDFLPTGQEMFKYSIDLNTPFSGATGIYWFSIMAYTTSPSIGWYWGLGEDDYWNEDLQWDYFGGAYTGNPGDNYADFAYEVTGERIPDVPEPATLTLFGLGLLGSAFARRRRNKK